MLSGTACDLLRVDAGILSLRGCVDDGRSSALDLLEPPLRDALGVAGYPGHCSSSSSASSSAVDSCCPESGSIQSGGADSGRVALPHTGVRQYLLTFRAICVGRNDHKTFNVFFDVFPSQQAAIGVVDHILEVAGANDCDLVDDIRLQVELESIHIGKIALLTSVSRRNTQELFFIAEVVIHEWLDKMLAVVRATLALGVAHESWIICASEKPHV
jgi:hypothetical protein